MNNLDRKWEFILWLFEVACSVGFLAMGAGVVIGAICGVNYLFSLFT